MPNAKLVLTRAKAGYKKAFPGGKATIVHWMCLADQLGTPRPNAVWPSLSRRASTRTLKLAHVPIITA